VRFDAECPDCGAVIKRESRTGRYESHAWVNGCERTSPDVAVVDVTGSAARSSQERPADPCRASTAADPHRATQAVR
jgi:hypothetical protein